jgi:hypothetical protein
MTQDARESAAVGQLAVFHRLVANTGVASVTNNFIWFAVTFWAYLETKSVLATAIIGGTYMLARQCARRVGSLGHRGETTAPVAAHLGALRPREHQEGENSRRAARPRQRRDRAHRLRGRPAAGENRHPRLSAIGCSYDDTTFGALRST